MSTLSGPGNVTAADAAVARLHWPAARRRPSWLVSRIPANSIGSPYGGPASFKSFILLDAARLQVAQCAAMAWPVHWEGGVVYVVAKAAQVPCAHRRPAPALSSDRAPRLSALSITLLTPGDAVDCSVQ